ncbi:MAG: hypothetical protein COB09_02795 [Thalassobium sp.]|jgi:hypothetical protein|nr:MAG: hypothetical protein COB09_02795 [Thalassobium sp.]
MKRSDFEDIAWLYKIVPLKFPREPHRFRKGNWRNIGKREFRSYIVRISIREKRSWPGPVRSHWRKLRFEAIEYFEGKWGVVPEAMGRRVVPPNYILYKSDGWSQWARS